MTIRLVQSKAFLREMKRLVWPERSLIGHVSGSGPLTPEEFLSLSFLSEPVCDACGRPVAVDTGPGQRCAACLARPPAWQRGRAALVYDDVSRRLVLDLKRSGRRDGLGAMASWMLQAGQELVDQSDLIVPVPLHYTRLAARGFNQSVWLAQAMAARTGSSLSVDALVRRRRTPSQAGLSARARRRNVAGAFRVRHSRIRQVAGRRILLVDDVLTTGATLSACCRALKKAGAAAVDVLVLARVVRETDITI